MLTAHDELRGAFEVFHKDGVVIKDDRDRLGGVLDLHELEVSDVMVHRTNMLSINIDQPSRNNRPGNPRKSLYAHSPVAGQK